MKPCLVISLTVSLVILGYFQLFASDAIKPALINWLIITTSFSLTVVLSMVFEERQNLKSLRDANRRIKEML